MGREPASQPPTDCEARVLSLYLPGHSLIHRVNAGLKLALLAASGALVMFVTSWPICVGALALIIVGYAIARVPPSLAWRLTRTILVFVLVIAGFQWWFGSATQAILVGLRLAFLVTAANLLTLTTPMSDLIGSVERILAPLRRLGVHPERIGLAIGLALRFIPVLIEQSQLIREAQAARGARNYFSYLMPLIIRTLRMADGVGEALSVRGFSEETK